VHPNERLLRREYEARAGRDDETVSEMLAEDVVWHVPGRGAISRVYRGRAEVMEYLQGLDPSDGPRSARSRPASGRCGDQIGSSTWATARLPCRRSDRR